MDVVTPEDVTAILQAHRYLVTDDGTLRDWWLASRRDGTPPDVTEDPEA